eukprot:TRINITY_DN2565_c2_g2_i1.p1 TRINITY_DN2565_c2_g2~~TRINITY_DN2565_c2_g2_i1.p1  ORF type:complete len:152 (+),score=6.04 TRINITY_DN2565_c2_g2_i1:721-1176(+)
MGQRLRRLASEPLEEQSRNTAVVMLQIVTAREAENLKTEDFEAITALYQERTPHHETIFVRGRAVDPVKKNAKVYEIYCEAESNDTARTYTDLHRPLFDGVTYLTIGGDVAHLYTIQRNKKKKAYRQRTGYHHNPYEQDANRKHVYTNSTS